jgi:hypothetical protein
MMAIIITKYEIILKGIEQLFWFVVMGRRR